MKAVSRMIGRVTSAGKAPARVRKMLCQASWVHIRQDATSKRIYQQLVSRNPKKKKIAIVAVMRRLAVRLWHRMRNVEVHQAEANRKTSSQAVLILNRS